MSDSERLRDDMALTQWDREAAIKAALRIAERAKKRAEEMQRQARAMVAAPPPLVPVYDMPCGFRAYHEAEEREVWQSSRTGKFAVLTRVSLPFVAFQHGREG